MFDIDTAGRRAARRTASAIRQATASAGAREVVLVAAAEVGHQEIAYGYEATPRTCPDNARCQRRRRKALYHHAHFALWRCRDCMTGSYPGPASQRSNSRVPALRWRRLKILRNQCGGPLRMVTSASE